MEAPADAMEAPAEAEMEGSGEMEDAGMDGGMDAGMDGGEPVEEEIDYSEDERKYKFRKLKRLVSLSLKNRTF
jgi:hypothetical protein